VLCRVLCVMVMPQLKKRFSPEQVCEQDPQQRCTIALPLGPYPCHEGTTVSMTLDLSQISR
jgi:hypothetical protein